jgi:hypothetical protein
MLSTCRRTSWRITLLAAVLACSFSRFAIAADDKYDIAVLSNRADLISGGDALVEVIVPPFIIEAMRHGYGAIKASIDGVPVPNDTFALRPNGRVQGLITGLKVGDNTLRVQVPGEAMQIVITNHPVGGPVFSGPQIQPWPCTTDVNGLGPALDAQCNAPTRYQFFYKDANTGAFKTYDPANPPPAAQIAMTTTDQGKTVSYIARLETGTINRGIYDIAVLFDPSQPWKPWAPQAAWNGKLQYVFGCAAAPGFGQAIHRACFFPFNSLPPEMQVFMTMGAPDYALSRGFAVAASTQTNLGNDLNAVVLAETLMMVKEHFVEQYGPVRYTIGAGGSGGAITQYSIANQYPGLVDGINPFTSFADWWSVGAVNGVDCPLLNNYFDNISPGLWLNVVQKDAVYGYGVGQPGQSGTAQCHGQGGVGSTGWNVTWDPMVGKQPSPQRGNCVAPGQIYNANSNPAGVRCSSQDYMVNIFGRRQPGAWGPVEREIGHGFANRFLDRVGVQYGLKALEQGVITPEQFVDLNEKIGGWDIDAKWQPQRTEADLEAVNTMYSTGQLVEGRQLANVAIIDYRPDLRGNVGSSLLPGVHANTQAAISRYRILKANGTVANRAEWIAPLEADVGADPLMHEPAFLAMDTWLARIEADGSNVSRPEKIIRNRPASAADGCFANGQRVDASLCSQYALDSDPLLVAGMPETRDVLKCQLKPLQRGDYNVVFTDAQWARLNTAFPTGVCDWSKPGMGQGSNVPWLSYADGPGGKPLGPEPKAEQDPGH